MITDDSIERIRDKAEVYDQVSRFLTLKKAGTNWVAPCPFHEEKSASFTVNPAKGIYKCFGCGEGGDAIKFVMKSQRIDFIEAIRNIAGHLNIPLEETEVKEADKKSVDEYHEMQKINEAAAEKYHKMFISGIGADHWVKTEIESVRQLNAETIIIFQLGYAPNEWKFLTERLIDKGLFQPATDLGLVVTSNNQNYDMFRNRIMFPIHNEKGQIVGFGGRKPEDNDKANPKYINSKESRVYKKDRVLYGLFQAAKAIRQQQCAILVEGYYDVVSFHQAGLQNTIAPCGTALTENQAKLLKKYTNHVILMGDGDNAGQKASLKTVDILLMQGFKVEICPLPKGEDPDSFSRNCKEEVLEEDINEKIIIS